MWEAGLGQGLGSWEARRPSRGFPQQTKEPAPVRGGAGSSGSAVVSGRRSVRTRGVRLLGRQALDPVRGLLAETAVCHKPELRCGDLHGPGVLIVSLGSAFPAVSQHHTSTKKPWGCGLFGFLLGERDDPVLSWDTESAVQGDPGLGGCDLNSAVLRADRFRAARGCNRASLVACPAPGFRVSHCLVDPLPVCMVIIVSSVVARVVTSVHCPELGADRVRDASILIGCSSPCLIGSLHGSCVPVLSDTS
jgi:hypothetical protein